MALRLLPSLGSDTLGVLATWVVGVLLGAATATVGLQAYGLVQVLRDKTEFFTSTDSEAIAFYGGNALQYGGLLLGLAALVYLVALRLPGRQ